MLAGLAPLFALFVSLVSCLGRLMVLPPVRMLFVAAPIVRFAVVWAGVIPSSPVAIAAAVVIEASLERAGPRQEHQRAGGQK
jgi:hypothetical protein